MKIKIKLLNKNAKIPVYALAGDAGLDLYSIENFSILPGKTYNTKLGFALEFPFGLVGRVADRGSLGKNGIHVFGGVYDAGYRGEYNVTLYNSTAKIFSLKIGDKIAQLIIQPIQKVSLQPVKNLSASQRGEGRFGSTDKVKSKIKNQNAVQFN